MYFVYVLESKQRRRFYIGSSANVDKRLIEHNKGKTPSTKPYRPWTVIHIEKFDLKSDATKRE